MMDTGTESNGSTTEAPGLPVAVTERAAKRIAEIIAADATADPGTMLRLSVLGGGCSGFQYQFDLVTTRQDDDLAIERDGVTVLIDETSLPFVEGSEIDFVEDLIGASFQVRNPNASSSCGCGTSFAI